MTIENDNIWKEFMISGVRDFPFSFGALVLLWIYCFSVSPGRVLKLDVVLEHRSVSGSSTSFVEVPLEVRTKIIKVWILFSFLTY